jgi:hypothetical protein
MGEGKKISGLLDWAAMAKKRMLAPAANAPGARGPTVSDARLDDIFGAPTHLGGTFARTTAL